MNSPRALRYIVPLILLCLTPAITTGQPPDSVRLRRDITQLAAAKHPRLDSQLQQLAQQVPTRDALALAADAPLSSGDSVAVSIRFRGDPAGLLSFLSARSAIVANISRDIVEAYVRVSDLQAMAEHPAVHRVEAIVPPMAQVTSQGRTVHNASNWMDAGLTGAGIKVGIIDLGFIGFGSLMGTELPSSVVVRCYRSVGVFTSNLADCQTSTNHGTGVAEAVVDIAPDAALFVANPMSWLDLRQTVQWMASQGVTVINYSLANSWNGPGDGTSPYSDSPLATVGVAVGSGILWVSSAGNSARATWTGNYADADGDRFLEFAPGIEANAVLLRAGQPFRAQARWTDNWSAASRDLDVYLLDASFNVVARSTNAQAGGAGQTPFEFLSYTSATSTTHYLLIEHFSGAAPGSIQVQAFSGEDLQYKTPAHSIVNPAESANPGLLAVGAASWHTPSTIEAFSSLGPTVDNRTKPDIVGADRGDSVTYGPGGFAGTSQAAPHVAGLAALVLQRFPGSSPSQAATYLKAQALPRGLSPNNTWGSGFAFLPTLCTYSVTPTNPSFQASGGPGSVSVITQDGCWWTATTNASWITLTSPSSGTANGTVSYSVAVNIAQSARTGTLTIAGRTITVTQSPFTTTDSDGDGLPNGWESLFGFDPNSPTGDDGGGGDPDGDGITNTAEYQGGTDPTIPNRWQLSEGSTGFFHERLAIVNPGVDGAEFDVTFLTETQPPIVRTYSLPVRRRLTINVNDIAEIGVAAVAAVVSARRGGVVVERTLMWDRQGIAYAGHTGKAVQRPRIQWFLAEGNAGFFDTWMLFANSNTQPATVTVTFLIEGGGPIQTSYSVPANARLTVFANEVPGLRDKSFSATITSSVPISVERSMYFTLPGQRFWEGGHSSPAIESPATTWFIAEGRTGAFFNTYLLLAHPGSVSANVTVRFLKPGGAVVTVPLTLPPASRTTLYVNGIDGLTDTEVSASITSTQPIIVERAMYWPGSFPNWYGAHNSAGVTATGTKWVLAEGETGGSLAFESYILLANPGSAAAAVTLTILRENQLPITLTRTVAGNARATVGALELGLASGERFGVLIESDRGIAVERVMYWNVGNQFWGAGTNETAVRLK